jgi:predicted nucleic acid-binding protein
MITFMTETGWLMNKVFLDTSFAVALSAPGDQNHQIAAELAEHMETEGTQFVTTRAIMLEIGNALAKLRYRQAAVKLLSALENDPRGRDHSGNRRALPTGP